MIVTKAIALVEDVPSENPNGEFEVILSAATLDRDKEIVDSRAFDPLPEHIPFDIDHGMTVTTTVGSGTPRYAEDGTLRVKGTYASTPLAQEVRTLVSEGHVRTTSVTFMAAERTADEKGIQHVTKAELINGTFTPVPSNRDAVVLSSKSLAALAEEKVGARNSATDAAAIQSMHDASVGLGAACEGAAKRLRRREVKSVVGSLEATQDRVRDALNDAYGTDAWVWLRATLPGDGGGSCVFEIDSSDGSDCDTYQQAYTDDGSVVTLTGDRTAVDLSEVITPDPDADTEPDSASAAPAASDSAAKAAEPDAAKAADDVASENLARWGELQSSVLDALAD